MAVISVMETMVYAVRHYHGYATVACQSQTNVTIQTFWAIHFSVTVLIIKYDRQVDIINVSLFPCERLLKVTVMMVGSQWCN
jgi:hypothetical protein